MTNMTRRTALRATAAALGISSLKSVSGQGQVPATALLQPAALSTTLEAAPASRPPVLFVGFPVLYRGGRIPGALLAGPCSKPEGLDALRAAVSSLPKDREIVIYCGCCPFVKCPNVGPAYQALQSIGFSRVKVLLLETNFHTDWAAKGYPVEKG
jgi:thiosulfate/3-mercaptopyruvate sulfurtransferase